MYIEKILPAEQKAKCALSATIVTSTVEDLVAKEGSCRKFCCHGQLGQVWSTSLLKAGKLKFDLLHSFTTFLFLYHRQLFQYFDKD